MKADRQEMLRYLGYRGKDPDRQTEGMLEEIAAQLEEKSLPKSIYREYDCCTAGNQIRLDKLVIESEKLAANLRGCSRAVLLAATIGPAADWMIKKYSIVNLAKAAIVQAAGAACIESYVDEIEEDIRKAARTRGLFLRPRFSPGYGDFSLEHQKDIFDMLECSRRIGLTLTEGNLMMPSKSVTAVIGLSEKDGKSGRDRDCSQCGKEDCDFSMP